MPESSNPSVIKPKVKFISYEGGGLAGIVLLGALKFYHRTKLIKKVKALSGSSAGAIMALMTATGWDYDKIYERFISLDFQLLLTSDNISIPIPFIGPWLSNVVNFVLAGYRLLTRWGMHSADKMEQLFESIVKEATGKDNCTFEEWHDLKEENARLYQEAIENPAVKEKYTAQEWERIERLSKLKDFAIEAAATSGFNIIFSSRKSPTSKRIHNNAIISKAIRASMAYPIYLTPGNINGNMFLDGGLQKNCPNEIFEKEIGVPNPDLISILIEDRDKIEYFLQNKPPKRKSLNSFLDYLSFVIKALTNAQSYQILRSPYKKQTIFCDSLGLGTFDYEQAKAKQAELIQSGLNNAIAYYYYASEDYRAFLNQYFTQEEIQTALASSIQPLVSCTTEVKAVSLTPDPAPLTPMMEKQKSARAPQSSSPSEDQNPALTSRELHQRKKFGQAFFI